MTTNYNLSENEPECKAAELLRVLSGKWKAQIFRLAATEVLRFNSLLRKLDGANKQSVATALKELEENGLLLRSIVSEKPLHVEYTLSEKGKSMIPIFLQLEKFSD